MVDEEKVKTVFELSGNPGFQVSSGLLRSRFEWSPSQSSHDSVDVNIDNKDFSLHA